VALVTVALTATPARAVLNEGLVEYWEFDGNYAAQVDPTHTGTPVANAPSTVSFVTGKFGQAIDLENADENIGIAYVRVGGDENDFDFEAQDMTVSLWYTTQSLYHHWLALIAKGEGDSWRLHRQNVSDTDVDFRGSSGYGALDQQDGSWHNVVATASTVNGTRIYVDGNEVATNPSPISFLGNDEALFIGNNPGAANRGWDGNIDDVALWGRELNPYEVSLIWNDGVGDSIASLLAQDPILLTLEVNTGTGEMKILGDEAESFVINSYQITSALGQLDSNGWNSLDDQDFPAGLAGDFDGNGAVAGADLLKWQTDGLTPAELATWEDNYGNSGSGASSGWEEGGAVNQSFLGEAMLVGNSTSAANSSTSLGTSYNGPAEGDLEFEYRTDDGLILPGIVTYVGAGAAAVVPEPASVALVTMVLLGLSSCRVGRAQFAMNIRSLSCRGK
jgi:hypothetical protein